MIGGADEAGDRPVSVPPAESGDPDETRLDPISDAVPEARRPTETPYDPARDRERMRTRLGIGILATTAVVGVIASVSIVAGADNSDALLTGVFTPLIGLSGAVMGFYFGGKDTSA